MSSPSESPEAASTLVIIGADDDPPLERLLAAGGSPPRVVRLAGERSEGRQLLELAASPGPVIYGPWPREGNAP